MHPSPCVHLMDLNKRRGRGRGGEREGEGGGRDQAAAWHAGFLRLVCSIRVEPRAAGNTSESLITWWREWPPYRQHPLLSLLLLLILVILIVVFIVFRLTKKRTLPPEKFKSLGIGDKATIDCSCCYC